MGIKGGRSLSSLEITTLGDVLWIQDDPYLSDLCEVIVEWQKATEGNTE